MKNGGILTTLICSSLVLVLTSCHNKLSNDSNNNGISTVNASSIVSDATLSKEQKAERLAKAAEQLFSMQGFAYASDVADLSLQTDSTNVRAQFVKAMLGPIVAQKGIYKRVKPLADLDTNAAAQYAQERAYFEEQYPRSTIKEFLLDGDEDIKNETDLQNYLDTVADSFKAIRLFAKEHKNAELTIMATDGMFDSMTKRFGEACTINQTQPYVYESHCPDVKSMLEVRLNRADFETIQQIAAGYELYFSLLNSYNLSGAINEAIKVKDQEVSSKIILDNLLQNKDFATLRSGNGFKKLKEMGLDAIMAMRWVMDNQNSLCPMGKENVHNRVGMLLNQGLCSDKSSAVQDVKNMALATDVLMGKILENVIVYEKYNYEYNYGYGVVIHDEYRTSVKPMSLFDNPITDLRNILPTSYDKCGNAIAIKDPTLNGVFVKGDYNTVLAKSAECNK